MKKIILIVGGIIVAAVLGRGIWAYQQMKADEARGINTPVIVATTTTGNTTPVILNEVITSTKFVASTTTIKIPVRANPKNDTGANFELCIGKDGIGTVAPLDQTKIITDPETGMEIVRDQILMIFKDGISEDVVNAKIKSINGVMVGCLAGMDDYQVRINGNPTLSQLKALVDQLNKDAVIEAASLHNIASMF